MLSLTRIARGSRSADFSMEERGVRYARKRLGIRQKDLRVGGLSVAIMCPPIGPETIQSVDCFVWRHEA
jgi:hypothetical protein